MLPLMIDTKSRLPYYEQIYQRLRDMIRSGELSAGTKLPSGRLLAEELALSRNTVSLAYEQLVSEGYIEAVQKSGYYVCKINELYQQNTSPKPVALKQKQRISYRYNFTPFAIDITSFPYSTWRRLYSRALNDLSDRILLQGENSGDPELKRAIAGYLQSSRGVKCIPEQILIGAGNDYLLQLLCQIFHAKPVIAMENPTYPKAYRIISEFGYQIAPIPVEKDGISMEALRASGAELVYVTPSHQYPLGVVMPIAKRSELLSWAAESKQRYIIEDDHDSEFRYRGKPIPSLQGSDYSDSVIYMGTFSRSISPGMRVGYLVLPMRLLRQYEEHLYLYSSTVSRTEQAVLTYFIRDGYFERHLNKMRKQYKARHDCMLAELRCFGNKVKISGEHAGLYLVLEFTDPLVTEEKLAQASEALGMCLRTMQNHYIEVLNHSRNGNAARNTSVLLGFACVEEEKIKEGIKELYHFLYGK